MRWILGKAGVTCPHGHTFKEKKFCCGTNICSQSGDTMLTPPLDIMNRCVCQSSAPLWTNWCLLRVIPVSALDVTTLEISSYVDRCFYSETLRLSCMHHTQRAGLSLWEAVPIPRPHPKGQTVVLLGFNLVFTSDQRLNCLNFTRFCFYLLEAELFRTDGFRIQGV